MRSDKQSSLNEGFVGFQNGMWCHKPFPRRKKKELKYWHITNILNMT
jgi:hypothetical protein